MKHNYSSLKKKKKENEKGKILSKSDLKIPAINCKMWRQVKKGEKRKNVNVS